MLQMIIRCRLLLYWQKDPTENIHLHFPCDGAMAKADTDGIGGKGR